MDLISTRLVGENDGPGCLFQRLYRAPSGTFHAQGMSSNLIAFVFLRIISINNFLLNSINIQI